MVHEWELDWFNGDEWEECGMYSFKNEPEYVRDKFMSEVYEDEVVENMNITHVGEVENGDHLPVI